MLFGNAHAFHLLLNKYLPISTGAETRQSELLFKTVLSLYE